MVRIVLIALAGLLVLGLPRFVSSPWFDDRYATDTQQPGGRLIRVELRDRSILALKGMGTKPTLSVVSEDDGSRISLSCVLKAVTLKGASAGHIETEPSLYCPYSRIPVRFDGFSRITLQLRDHIVIAEREYRRNPAHTLIEWMKWRINPNAGISYYKL